MTAAAASGYYDSPLPPQLILPGVLSPGDIYYIAENSIVVCVSQGHQLHHYQQAQPHIIYARSSSVAASAASSTAVVTVAPSTGPRKGRFHSGSFESTPPQQQQLFFSMPAQPIYSFSQPAPTNGDLNEEVVMEVVGEAAVGEEPEARATNGDSVNTMPLNIITNQELSIQAAGQHPAHQMPPQAHHLYQPPTPTQSHQQQMLYGLAAGPAPQTPAQSAGAPQTSSGGSGGSMSESTEQQLIRHHKLALSMLKNGSLQTAFSNMAGEEALLEVGEEEARTAIGNLDSAWVPKASLVERICGNQGDSLQVQCMMRCLSDFKPCMKEKEIEGRFYIRLRQHREMSLNVETEYILPDDEDDKRYRIVDEHMKEVVEKITKLVRSTCQHEGRQVMRLVNRNSVVFYAEPGFSKTESDNIVAELHRCTECECEKCNRLSFVIKFRCIIDDNRLAKLLEQTPNAPMSYNMMPPQNHPGIQRPGIEMGMSNLTLGGAPHEVAGMASHMIQSGPYSPLVSMGQEAGHHPPAQQQQQQHPHHQQQQPAQQSYYPAGGHAPQAGHGGLPHSNLSVSASSIFTGPPILTLNPQHSTGTGSPGIIAWTTASQQAGQQTPTHGLQSPEYLFSAYNVANITPGYPNVASPSASGPHPHPSSHSLHHAQHHFPPASLPSRHPQASPSSNPVQAQRQLSGSGQMTGGGAKSLISNSGQPQKEKNLPPRLQSQHRMAQAAAANAGAPFGGPNGGYNEFIFPAAPAGGGYFQPGGGRGGPGGRRGASSYGGGRGSRGRISNYHGAGGYGLHQSGAMSAMTHSITGPGGPLLPHAAPSVPPTPPDLQADFPHLPRVTAPSQAHQEAIPDPASTAAALPSAPSSQPASPGGNSGPALSTYAAVVVNGDPNAN